MTATPVRTCIYILANGAQCKGIALRDSPHCHHHHGHRRRLKRGAVCRTLDSPLGQNVAISQIISAIYDNRIDPEVARSLLYAIHVTATFALTINEKR